MYNNLTIGFAALPLIVLIVLAGNARGRALEQSD